MVRGIQHLFLFHALQTLHMTVCMLKLYSPERVFKAAQLLQQMEQELRQLIPAAPLLTLK
jgi:hypothetical protein